MGKRKEIPKRESGLKRLNPKLRSSEPQILLPIDSLNDEILNDYPKFESAYDKLSSIQRKKRKEPVAYLVWYKDRPELNYISFQVETPKHIDRARDRARAEANRYLRSTNPEFAQKQNYYDIYMMSRGKRVPQFDKYYETKRVPIKELMKIGFTYSCAFCHNHRFNLEDYDNYKCYVVEGENTLNPFTNGILLCYNCYKKLLK
jgi:hypothetical protein